MTPLDANFVATLAATETRPLILVEIAVSTPIRLCSWGDVAWDGRDWMEADVEATDMVADATGAWSAVLTIGNTDNEIQAYLLNQRIRDRAITIHEAWLDGTGTLRVIQRPQGYGGAARSGPDKAVITVRGTTSTGAESPSLMVAAVIGFPPPKPAGTKISWNGQDYLLERRLGQ